MFDFVPENSRKISYASSFSCLHIPDEMKARYRYYLKQYSAISVRENNGIGIIRELLDRKAEVVLDPTLLIDHFEWRKLSVKACKIKLPKKYILCYMLAYSFSADEPMNILLTRVQSKYNMPVIMLKNAPENFKGEEFLLPHNYNLGIPEFLYLIQNASIVVSSSFHGTAFSLNFAKPLIALAKENEDDRVASLIGNLGLYDNLFMTSEVETKELNPYYDIPKEQEKLNDLRMFSMDFLIKSLS